MPETIINLEPINEIPTYAEPIIRAIGIGHLSWGKLEQHLDILLNAVSNERYVTGATQLPKTSFRLKAKLFKQIYAEHPNFKVVHQIAGPVCDGLKKANTSRVRLTHSNVQGFSPGPPAAISVRITDFNGPDLRTKDGSWTLQDIEDFVSLLSHLSTDFGKISKLTMNEAFRKSLEI
ncbi:MAG: hypothetical protein GY791_16325 [Alphaproteobacteria bacterium]|nr:hypothetical protein [Alphaproteobacteria bacterium]